MPRDITTSSIHQTINMIEDQGAAGVIYVSDHLTVDDVSYTIANICSRTK